MENKNETSNLTENGNKSKPLLSSRLLKFRAWNGNSMIHSSSYVSLQWFFNACTSSKIMQYTNLTDRDNNEIYDGDIIEWIGFSEVERMRVYWRNGAWYFKRYETEKYFDWDKVDTTEIRVIGNIFQNPELL